MKDGSPLWRIGHEGEPLAFTPREYCAWTHRFDDPRREYRTLYCAAQRITCFRETLANFRPDARAIREYRQLFGVIPDDLAVVPQEWRDQLLLAPGRLRILEGELVDVDDPPLRRDFERDHAGILMDHGMDHLDISEVRSRNRPVTQALSRYVFDRGAAGLVFGSDLDDLPCIALFEGRARVDPDGEGERLSDVQEFLDVCKEFGLKAP